MILKQSIELDLKLFVKRFVIAALHFQLLVDLLQLLYHFLQMVDLFPILIDFLLLVYLYLLDCMLLLSLFYHAFILVLN